MFSVIFVGKSKMFSMVFAEKSKMFAELPQFVCQVAEVSAGHRHPAAGEESGDVFPAVYKPGVFCNDVFQVRRKIVEDLPDLCAE